MNDGKITSISGDNKPNEMAEAVRAIAENMEEHLKYMDLLARLRRRHYLACIDHGFTEQEALKLAESAVRC